MVSPLAYSAIASAISSSVEPLVNVKQAIKSLTVYAQQCVEMATFWVVNNVMTETQPAAMDALPPAFYSRTIIVILLLKVTSASLLRISRSLFNIFGETHPAIQVRTISQFHQQLLTLISSLS